MTSIWRPTADEPFPPGFQGEGGIFDQLAGSVEDAIDPLAPLTEGITVGIPTDYATLQDAIDDLSGRHVAQGAAITLLIEAGHSPTTGIVVEGGDFGHFVIDSEDAVVTVDGGWAPDTDFVFGSYAVMPTLDALIDMGDLGRNGYVAWRASRGHVRDGAGVRNAGLNGCQVANGSAVSARNSEFTGSGDNNVKTGGGGAFHGQGGTFSGAKGEANANIRRASLAHLHAADLSGGAGHGLFVMRATVYAGAAVITGAGGDAIRAEQASVVRVGSRETYTDCSNAGERGISALNASVVDAHEADCSGAGTDGVFAAAGATVDFTDGIADNCGDVGIEVWNGAKVIARNASVQGSTGDDVQVNHGSQVVLGGASTTNGAGAPDVGDTNVSAFNAIDGNRGIVWS